MQNLDNGAWLRLPTGREKLMGLFSRAVCYRLIKSGQIRGKVVDITQSGADQHIDSLAKKYLNQDKYPYGQPGEVRVLYKIELEKVSSMG